MIHISLDVVYISVTSYSQLAAQITLLQGMPPQASPIGTSQACRAGSAGAECRGGSCGLDKAPVAASIFCPVTQPAQRKPLTNCTVMEVSEQGVTFLSVASLSPALELR